MISNCQAPSSIYFPIAKASWAHPLKHSNYSTFTLNHSSFDRWLCLIHQSSKGSKIFHIPIVLCVLHSRHFPFPLCHFMRLASLILLRHLYSSPLMLIALLLICSFADLSLHLYLVKNWGLISTAWSPCCESQMCRSTYLIQCRDQSSVSFSLWLWIWLRRFRF